jgi:hypothetical protein
MAILTICIGKKEIWLVAPPQNFPVVAKSSDDAYFCDHKCSERRWAAVAS